MKKIIICLVGAVGLYGLWAQPCIGGRVAPAWPSPPAADATETLYLAGPFEEEILGTEKIWPRYFNETRPLREVDLPQLYRRAQAAGEGWNSATLEQAHTLSVLMSAAHYDTLLAIFSTEEKTAKKAPDCGLLEQEKLFRLIQLQRAGYLQQGPPYAERLARLLRCRPESPVARFLVFFNELERKNYTAAEMQIAELQKIHAHGKKIRWSTYLSGKLSRTAELMLVEKKKLLPGP